MSRFTLVQLVKNVSVKTLESGDKQGEIVLRTLEPGDVLPLSLLANQVEVKVTYEYKDEKAEAQS